MKLKNSFITQDFGSEHIMVSTGESGFVGLTRSNDTAAFIVNCLKKDTTKEKIVDDMCERYEASREVIKQNVDEIIDKLRKIGAIDE